MSQTTDTILLTHIEASVLNALCEHIAVLNASGHIVFVNQAWKTFANKNGYSGNNYGIGENYISVVAGLEIKKGMQQVLQNKIPHYTHEYPCHSPTEERWFWLYVTPLYNAQNQVIGLVTSHINITERKLAEQQVETLQKQLLQAESNRVLTETAGAAAHEINQPLTAILGLSDLLSKRTDLPQDIKADIQEILKGSEKIKSIIKKMQQAKTYVSKPYVGDTNIVDFQASKDASDP